MSKWLQQQVAGLHDPATGALVGLMGADGKEYMLPGRNIGVNALVQPNRDVLIVAAAANDGTWVRTSGNVAGDGTYAQIGPTITVPANLMRETSILRVWHAWNCTNNAASTRTVGMRWGGAGGSTVG